VEKLFHVSISFKIIFFQKCNITTILIIPLKLADFCQHEHFHHLQYHFLQSYPALGCREFSFYFIEKVYSLGYTLGTFRIKNTLSLEFGFESPREKALNFPMSGEELGDLGLHLWRPELENLLRA